MFGKVRKIYKWIVKSIQYARFLWNDADYDSDFIFRLLQYKLKRTRKQIVSNNIIADCDEVADQIKYAEDLIQKHLDDDWGVKDYDEYEKKWGEKRINGYRSNANTEELRKQASKELLEVSQKVNTLQENNLDKLFSHIKKYILNWWD